MDVELTELAIVFMKILETNIDGLSILSIALGKEDLLRIEFV